MKAFTYGAFLQWMLDFRNKNVVLTYYVVPLVFFAFMSGIFTSIDPLAKQTLIQSMTVFGVSMGALLGTPAPLVELYGSEMKKAFRIGKIPLWTVAVNNFLSGFVHLFLMSMIILITAPIAFDASTPQRLTPYFVMLVIFIAACTMIGTVLGVFIKSHSKLTMLSQLIFLPSVMLSGIMFPVNMLPKALESIGKIFPATWGYMNMCNNSFEASSIVPLVLIFAIAAAISIWRIRLINKI